MKFSRRKILISLVSVTVLVVLVYVVRKMYAVRGSVTQPSVPSEVLNVDKNFDFPKDFPPDPGEEGKKTIEGIDSDHDGVRDDVQRWIYAFVPKEPKKQMALRQMARSYQDDLRDDFDLLEVRRASDVLTIRSIQCRKRVFDDELHGYTENSYLRAKVLNTYIRTVRYLENDAKITTEEMSGEQPKYQEPCENR